MDKKADLQKRYARSLLQLETESKAVAANSPQSKVARSARKTIDDIGRRLYAISDEWDRLSTSEPIIPALFTAADFD